jgi:3-oxoacyl-[acyl-carrier-protein] synthase-3
MSQVYGMAIKAITAYAPKDRWPNERIAARLQTEAEREDERLKGTRGYGLSDEERRQFQTNRRWLLMNTGFSERRFAAEGEGTIDLGLKAAKLLIEKTGLNPADIDRVIFGRVTPSYPYSPPDAALLQHMLGIPALDGQIPREVKGLDTSLACSTYVASLEIAYGLIRSGLSKNVLLVAADAMGTTINWTDRAFATVLGDAGTATWLSAVHEDDDWFGPNNFWGFVDGSKAELIITPKGGSRNPLRSYEDLASYQHCLSMDGKAVKDIIVPLVGGPATDAALAKVGWTLQDLQLVTLHEANRTQLNAQILDMWRERGFAGKVIDARGEFGNTTSASVPLAKALNPEALQPNTKFGDFVFGGGFSCSFAFGQIRDEIITATDV